jgi:small-conductance mechanosensitive channel
MVYFDPIIKALHQYGINFLEHVPNIVAALLFIILTYIFTRIIHRIIVIPLKRIRIRANLIQVFQKILSFIIWFIGILIVATILFPSVTIGNLLATLGLTSVAIGFAFKDIFENFLAGILILLREPFHLSDFIICKDEQGYVERISLRNTHIRQTDGSRVVIPNSILYTNPIQILTDQKYRRSMIKISVNFSEDHEKVRKIITSAVKECKSVSQDNYIQVYIASYSSNGIDFEIYWWTHSKPGDIRLSCDEVFSSIKKALNEANIELTYSTTISFQDELKLKNFDKKKEHDNDDENHK